MDNQESSNNGEDQEEAGCTNSHIISAQTIISFTENMDAVMFVLTLFSSFLQLYVMFAALKHIKRKTSDKCLHVFLLSMTMADFLLTALCYPVELAPRAGLISKFPRFVNISFDAHFVLDWVDSFVIISSLFEFGQVDLLSFSFEMLNPLLTVSILPQYRMGFVRDVLLCQSLRTKRRMTDQRRNYYTSVAQRGSSDAAI
uniref:G-protein coupled receptors family 1 profile domain-containing protein n=1 Tax=Meloidogyne javanica TaxID=6303 RepID=A0A915MEU2_MELJA